MAEDEYIKNHYNAVDTLTAVCLRNAYPQLEYYPKLEIGKTYKVTHIGVWSSNTDLLLEGMGEVPFDAASFEIYENGKSLGLDYVRKVRFWAPSFRRSHHVPDEVINCTFMPDGRFVELKPKPRPRPRNLRDVRRRHK